MLAMLIVLLFGAGAVGTGAAVLYGLSSGAKNGDMAPASYFADVLFRPSNAASNAASRSSTAVARPSNLPDNASARAEATRMLEAGLVRGERLTADDHARLTVLISAKVGISPQQAAQRINRL